MVLSKIDKPTILLVTILDYGRQDDKFQRAAFSKGFNINGGTMEACLSIELSKY